MTPLSHFLMIGVPVAAIVTSAAGIFYARSQALAFDRKFKASAPAAGRIRIRYKLAFAGAAAAALVIVLYQTVSANSDVVKKTTLSAPAIVLDHQIPQNPNRSLGNTMNNAE